MALTESKTDRTQFTAASHEAHLHIWRVSFQKNKPFKKQLCLLSQKGSDAIAKHITGYHWRLAPSSDLCSEGQIILNAFARLVFKILTDKTESPPLPSIHTSCTWFVHDIHDERNPSSLAPSQRPIQPSTKHWWLDSSIKGTARLFHYLANPVAEKLQIILTHSLKFHEGKKKTFTDCTNSKWCI